MSRRQCRSIGVLCCVAFVQSAASGQDQQCYSIASVGDQLLEIDETTGATISSVVLTVAGQTVVGGNGLAWDSVTQELWGIVRVMPANRLLCRINRITGEAVSVGQVTDQFSAIAFDASGTLYGLTGEAGLVLTSLFTLSTADASSTLVMNLNTANFDGEALAANPMDGLLYHLSGGFPSLTARFESVDPVAMSASTITQSGDAHGNPTALGFDPLGGTFLMAAGANLFRLTDGGLVTQIGVMSVSSKGIACIPVITVPTVGAWGTAVMALMLVTSATIVFHRRRALAA